MGLDVLYLLIPASVALALAALALFLWAIHSGQFDDLETPAIRVLFDDSPAVPAAASTGAQAGPAEPARPGAAAARSPEEPQTRASE